MMMDADQVGEAVQRSWSLHDQWQALAGPNDPALTELWQMLTDYYVVVWEICPPPLLNRLDVLLDGVQVPQTAEEWEAFGILLAQIDALIIAHGRVHWVADEEEE